MSRVRVIAVVGLIVAALVLVASVAGVSVSAVYSRETESWRVQGMAQDWADLLIAVPWLVITAVLAWRGSRRGALLLGGGLAYAAYSFAIYAFAVHFNALFLVYVAILGLSAFGVVELVRTLDGKSVSTWFDQRAPRAVAGVALMSASLVFAVLWLAQIVPALVAGRDPAGLDEVGLITNPVHILDLAFVLPLLFGAGLWLRRGDERGFLLGSILLGFSVLMDVALVFMMVALHARGLSSDLVVPAAFTVITGVFAGLLIQLMRSVVRPSSMRAPVLFTLLGLTACGPTTVSDDASTRMSEAAFVSLADAVGRRIDGTVGASGEAMLGDDGVPHRWARVDPDERGRARGAYLIEDGGRFWLVTYETDGRTEGWTGDAFTRGIEHAQGHVHGSETILFGLRGGELVVLAYELVDEDAPEENVSRRCEKRCPALRGFATQDARLQVLGPAGSVDELTSR